MKATPASAFTWEKYGPRNAVPTISLLNMDGSLQKGITLLGWCDAGQLVVRPRPGEKAILVQLEDGLEVWCHVSNTQLDTILCSEI